MSRSNRGKSVCPDCGAVVSDLGKHRRRNRCTAQHYHSKRLWKQALKEMEKGRRDAERKRGAI